MLGQLETSIVPSATALRTHSIVEHIGHDMVKKETRLINRK
jgi:hypothetical protein